MHGTDKVLDWAVDALRFHVPHSTHTGTPVTEEGERFAVLANPIKRCGVRLTAEQHAEILSCKLITEPKEADGFDFVYLHWHPNFDWQHPKWTKDLSSIKTKVALIVHDFLFHSPVPERNIFFIASFDRKAVPMKDAIVIHMPLQQPYPFRPKSEPDPDKCGFFGFFGANKGIWTIMTYAQHHKRKARFITTIHPFAPPWTHAEFAEFKATATRLGFEVIDEWLVGQELADAMGECGFFVIIHKGGFGASGSVTSALAACRPVFANETEFIKEARKFVMKFNFDVWPSESELAKAIELVDEAHKYLSPQKIWSELHAQVLDALHSGCYNF